MDAEILLWLNGLVGRFAVLDKLMTALVSDYLAPVTGSMVLLGLWFYGRSNQERLSNQITTITGALAVGFSNALVAIVNVWIFRDRPFVDHDVDLLFYRPTDSSFPANVAGVGFGLATAVYLKHRRIGLALYALAGGWAFARVYAGVHYPSDVLAGAAIGVAAAFLAVGFAKLIGGIVRPVVGVFRLFYVA